MLERLVVRPELAAFEPAVRERVDRLGAMDEERIARPRAIERDHDGALVVVSEFVPGSRLSDLLDTSVQQGAVPGVDVALGYLLDVLPALCALHAGAAFPHGTISPGRTILTPAGQVVLLDAAFGGALGRLHYSRRRLWIEFGIALPPSAGPPRLDESADVAQCAMAAVMLVTGRPIGEHEFPGGLAAVVTEVVDVALIRGTSAFAKGLQNFLQRALPLPGRKPYAMTDEAAVEIRQLAGELGLDGCRRALVDFIEQMESIGDEGLVSFRDTYESSYATEEPDEDEHDDPDLLLDDDDGTEVDLDAEPEAAVYDLSADSTDESEPASAFTSPAPELDRYFESGGTDAGNTPHTDAETSYDASSYSTPVDSEPSYSSASSSESSYSSSEPEPILTPPARAREPEFAFGASESTTYDSLPEPQPVSEPEPFSSPYSPEPEPEVASATPAAATTDDHDGDDAAEASEETVEEQQSGGWRRRKRTKSVRARKDKLRSTTAPAPKPAPPPSPPPPAAVAAPAPAPAAAKPAAEKPSSWLVPPSRAASFDPPVPEFQTPVIPPPPPPAPQVMAPPPVAPPAPTYAPPPPMPSWTPTVLAPPPPPPPAPPKPVSAPPAAPPAPIALKLKDTAPKRPARSQPAAADIYSSAPPEPRGGRQEEQGAFPWKLAAAVIVVVAIGVVVGRAYLPGGSTARKPAATASSAESRPETPAKAGAPSGPTGRIQIETNPSGARVLLDGKAVGESPLTLEGVPAGRHSLTFVSGSGTVPRTVRVEAGKTAKVDVSIFSGWVGIFAPIVLDVSEDGRSIGTTEQERLMLPPGRHQLTLTNRALGYSSVQTVDIEPGQVRSLTIDPRGDVNFNALPWAEVWIDGQKVDDTPIANLKVPLGVREIVFKHPQFGERRTTITVKGNAPTAVVMDMTK